MALTAVLVLALASGCGLETEKANQYMSKAARHQEAAEAILNRLKNFPAEWEALFNVASVGPAQVTAGRQLTLDREADVDALNAELVQWENDLKPILELNVDAKVKEYIRLKLAAIDTWKSYAEEYLIPLIESCQGMVEIIAYGRPASEQAAKAEEIAGQVNEAATKLQECLTAEKKADEYFQDNKLGK
jgi:hypothetical protein